MGKRRRHSLKKRPQKHPQKDVLPPSEPSTPRAEPSNAPIEDIEEEMGNLAAGMMNTDLGDEEGAPKTPVTKQPALNRFDPRYTWTRTVVGKSATGVPKLALTRIPVVSPDRLHADTTADEMLKNVRKKTDE